MHMQLCLEKKLVTAAALRQMVEEIQMAGQQGHGQKLVAHAWADSAFKARLLKDGGCAAAELGVSADGISSKAGITGKHHLALDNRPVAVDPAEVSADSRALSALSLAERRCIPDMLRRLMQRC